MKTALLNCAGKCASTESEPSKGGKKRSKNRRLKSIGTGLVVNDHYIVTADHVIDDSGKVSIWYIHQESDVNVVVRDSTNVGTDEKISRILEFWLSAG